MKKLFVFVMILIFAVSAYAEDLYVTTTGTGNGKEDSPWGIEDINSSGNWGIGEGKISAGDTVHFADGTYTRSGAQYAMIWAQDSGSDGALITFQSTNRHGAILDCAWSESVGIYVYGDDYLVFDGFKITNANNYGFRFRDGHDVTIRNCWIKKTNYSSILTNSDTYNVTIDRCLLEEMDEDGGSTTGYAVYAMGYNLLIQNNIMIHDETYGSYMIKMDGHTVGGSGESWGKLINNTIVGHRYSDDRANHITISNDHGEDIGGYDANDPIIRNNAFVDPGYYSGPTAVMHGGNGSDSVDSGWVLTNNVTDAINWIDNQSGYTESNNKKASDGVTFLNFKAQFTDYDNNDFTLVTPRPGTEWLMDAGTATDAPAVDYTGSTSRPQGAADDIGAYEFVGDPPVTITNALPTGTIVCTSNPRDVTMTWETTDDAPCNCRISDTDEGDYDDMPADSVTNTDAASHSDTESLACGAAYTRYVYCEDTLGNEVGPETISFSIETGTPPPPVSGLTVTGGGVSGGSM